MREGSVAGKLVDVESCRESSIADEKKQYHAEKCLWHVIECSVMQRSVCDR
jgi:hypothetical protein